MSHRLVLGLLLVLTSIVALPSQAADTKAVDGTRCVNQLATFAGDRGIAFNAAHVTYSARWTGAGHEVKRLPGVRARIPVEHCGAALVVDMTEDCKIAKSQGEGACRSAYPMTFH